MGCRTRTARSFASRCVARRRREEGGWFSNLGSATAPQFGAARRLLPPAAKEPSAAKLKLGAEHINGPRKVTRVATADVDGDGDGKLDLLVGDAKICWNAVRPANGNVQRTRRGYRAPFMPAQFMPAQLMTAQYEVRANYDRDSVVVYQAYDSRIAEPALKA